MKRLPKAMMRRRSLATLLSAGFLFQFGGCDLGQITTTVTLEPRELLITVVRGAILTPIDRFVTDRINEAFGVEDE